MKEKGNEDEKKSADENSSPYQRTTISYWTPSIESSVPLLITLRYLPIILHREESLGDEACAFEESNYLYQLSMAPVILVGGFCIITFLCNAIIGRRPDYDDRHNPRSHQVIQSVGDAVSPTLAILGSIFRAVSTTILGNRAKAINRIINKASIGADMAARAATTADELYDHAMDRCPKPNTGDMRRIEYGAMLAENAIVASIELIAHGGFLAMNMGVIRITLTPQNVLYAIAGIYRTADLTEALLINYVNDIAYYLENIVDLPPISAVLQAAGLSYPDAPIHGVDPRNIPERIQDGIENIGDAIIDAAHTIGDGFEELGENIKEFVTGSDDKKAPEEDRKMTQEELEAYNQQQQHQPTTFRGPVHFGRTVMSHAETQTDPDITEKESIPPATSSSSEENHTSDGRGFFSSLFHSEEEVVAINIPPAPPMATLNQQHNGSYTMGIPYTIGNADINIPPELFNHITFNDMHFEVRRVPAGEEHHGRTGSYFSEHHRNLDQGIDSYRISEDSSTHTPRHTLIRLDGWEILIYGVESPFTDAS